MSTSMLASCGVTDQKCLCQPTLAMYIQKCEQCLFNFFVATNSIPADPKLGANTALSAYTGACTAEANINMTLALTIAPGWQGHKVEVLNTGVTVLVVGLGGIMGLSLLYIMSNLD
ncbi:hypothetical protein EXIGLDRAFT_118217 [Exidia glandulosa HHB12029]|uniref:Uncharacterized protein n=1 Tax=Exidia glandulosa HHB12029 TaxID=1314781 RepID=A0A165GIB2_EXIGL|nr:hypothetical protein EXIGLDRAFT_118217 [Exidia glandulosa HHB12029]